MSRYSQSNENLWTYNALDCCVTHEVFEALQEYRDENTDKIYAFEKALQAPAIEMMLRGILVDQAELSDQIRIHEQQIHRLRCNLERLAQAAWGCGLNPNSPKQLKEFFYEHCGFPEQKIWDKGEMKVSTNEECLLRLKKYFYAQPFISHILKLRGLIKRLSVLKTGVSRDGRMRTSYKIAGTETGRWASAENAFGEGTNFQNLEHSVRKIFVAENGRKFAYIDLQSAESLAVGALAWQATGIDTYWRGGIEGDIHLFGCRMMWPERPWTGDDKKDKELAKEHCQGHYNFRDMIKRGGHGSNYYGKPAALAKRLSLPIQIMVDFQHNYFKAFPEIPQWHQAVARQLQLTAQLTTPFGRKRTFFGRLGDDSTLREAIAYGPQSLIGDILNSGLLQVWQRHRHEVWLLAQVHDAILISYPEELEDDILPRILTSLKVELPIHREEETRILTIGCDAEVGWNWGDYDEENNPGGLRAYTGRDERKRDKPASTSLLDRLVY